MWLIKLNILVSVVIILLHVSVFLYAGDILLLSPSVSSLHTLLAASEDELTHLDMQINVNKSTCIRFGVSL